MTLTQNQTSIRYPSSECNKTFPIASAIPHLLRATPLKNCRACGLGKTHVRACMVAFPGLFADLGPTSPRPGCGVPVWKHVRSCSCLRACMQVVRCVPSNASAPQHSLIYICFFLCYNFSHALLSLVIMYREITTLCKCHPTM